MGTGNCTYSHRDRALVSEVELPSTHWHLAAIHQSASTDYEEEPKVSHSSRRVVIQAFHLPSVASVKKTRSEACETDYITSPTTLD